ncbi:MAG: type III restriction endonuclease subunit R, partial [Pseudomonadota bacterium]
MANRKGRGRTKTARRKIKFEHRLVLANWLLDLFEAMTLEDLAKGMKDSDFEGLTDNNITKFHQILTLRLFERSELSNDILLAYDQNIVQHWKQITEKRNRKEGRQLKLKYFQYLCLLFTEVYLDRYFRNSEKLLADLNKYTVRFNAGETRQQPSLGSLFATGLPDDARIAPFTEDDLKKLAFWSATGSGKTLLMHVNIMQYR